MARRADDDPETDDPRCAFGTPFMTCVRAGGCRGCRKHADELEAQFWRDVFFGKFDAQGYSPNERALMERREG